MYGEIDSSSDSKRMKIVAVLAAALVLVVVGVVALGNLNTPMTSLEKTQALAHAESGNVPEQHANMKVEADACGQVNVLTVSNLKAEYAPNEPIHVNYDWRVGGGIVRDTSAWVGLVPYTTTSDSEPLNDAVDVNWFRAHLSHGSGVLQVNKPGEYVIKAFPSDSQPGTVRRGNMISVVIRGIATLSVTKREFSPNEKIVVSYHLNVGFTQMTNAYIGLIPYTTTSNSEQTNDGVDKNYFYVRTPGQGSGTLQYSGPGLYWIKAFDTDGGGVRIGNQILVKIC